MSRRLSLIPFNHGQEKSLVDYEVINPAAIEQILKLNEKTVAQLKRITSYDFDIFDLR
jgi:hypothetical protein